MTVPFWFCAIVALLAFAGGAIFGGAITLGIKDAKMDEDVRLGVTRHNGMWYILTPRHPWMSGYTETDK